MPEPLKTDLERLVQTIEYLRQSRDESSAEWLKSLGQAQLLSQFYTGLESMFEKGLKLLGVEVPNDSGRFHQEILTLALRHDLVSENESEYLFDLLAFRHFARRGYGIVFRSEEVD
jgi:hypothetical protein